MTPIADLELFNLLCRNQDDEKKSEAEKQKANAEISQRFARLGALPRQDRGRSQQ